MISWMVSKPRLISLGALEKLLESLGGMSWNWNCETLGDYCYISFNNPDEYGVDRPCTFRFPIVGNLGNHELEQLILIDGVVEHQTLFSRYEYCDEDSGEPYFESDPEFDWSAAIEPIFEAFDKAFTYKISLNPNL